MSLLEKIKEASLESRKNRDTALSLVLTTLYAEAAKVGKDKGNRDSTDEEVIAVIKKNIAGAEECMKVAQHKEKYKYEVDVLSVFLPRQLTEQEIQDKVSILVISGITNLGLIMKHFKENHAGLYDGKVLSEIVKRCLS